MPEPRDLADKAREINRQMYDDPNTPTTGVVVGDYTDNGKKLWAVRCWGDVPECDGMVSIGHESEQEAEDIAAVHRDVDHKRWQAERSAGPTAAELLDLTEVPPELTGRSKPFDIVVPPLLIPLPEVEAAYRFLGTLLGKPEPGEWTPPPPGSTREQLPEHILQLIRPYMRPYLATACETAFALGEALVDQHTAGNEALAREVIELRERMRERCRANHKFTGEPCVAPHHWHHEESETTHG